MTKKKKKGHQAIFGEMSKFLDGFDPRFLKSDSEKIAPRLPSSDRWQPYLQSVLDFALRFMPG